MKTGKAVLAGSVIVGAIIVLAPAAAWAGSFRFGGHPVRLGGVAGPSNAGAQQPAGKTKTVTQQTVVIITNPDARPIDHLPFLHPFVRTFDVSRPVIVIETDVSVSASNGNASPTAGHWAWQPGRWVWSGSGWAWWPGRWVWTE